MPHTSTKSDEPLHEQVRKLVKGLPMRSKALAALLGVQELALRESIALPESPVELTNAGWVRLKIPAANIEFAQLREWQQMAMTSIHPDSGITSDPASFRGKTLVLANN